MRKFVFIAVIFIFTMFFNLPISAKEENWQKSSGSYAQLKKSEQGEVTATLWDSSKCNEKKLVCQIINETQIEIKNYIPYKTVHFTGKRFQDEDSIEYSSKKEFEISVLKKPGTDICLNVIVTFPKKI